MESLEPTYGSLHPGSKRVHFYKPHYASLEFLKKKDTASKTAIGLSDV